MSVLVYSLQTVPIIYNNVQWNGYTGPNAGTCGKCTWFPSEGTNNYPFPHFVPDAACNPMTFWKGDGDSNAIGIQTADPYLMNALQGGSTIGNILAPRAIQPDMGNPYYYSVLANWWYCSGREIRPWQAPNRGLRISANIVLPFLYVPGSPGLLDVCGIVFVYFVACLRNVIDQSQNIFLCPRILQSQYPMGTDIGTPYEWDFGPGDQISWDDPDSAALLFPECKPGSAWISSPGNGYFQIGPNPYMKNYAWCMSATQFATAVSAINASPRVPRSDYDTNASNWMMRIINLDMEAWAPIGADPRLGLSFNCFKALTL